MKSKIAIVLVIVLIVSFFIWRTDKFQKIVFPQKNWNKQIQDIEWEITYNQSEYFFTLIAIEKIKIYSDSEMTISEQDSRLMGRTNMEFVKDAKEDMQSELYDYLEISRDLKQEENRLNQRLQDVKIKLAEYE